jgi:hypothetical protein
MPTTKPSLKHRLIMVFMILVGWVLSVAYLSLRIGWLPEWGCYVPLVLGAGAALFYKHRLTSRTDKPAEPEPCTGW